MRACRSFAAPCGRPTALPLPLPVVCCDAGDSEVQRTMLELLNQLDGFEASNKIKVGGLGQPPWRRPRCPEPLCLAAGCCTRSRDPGPHTHTHTPLRS